MKKTKTKPPKPIVDFTEIAQPGTGNGDQDDFEFFAQDFLKSQDYEIIRQPSRGADGGVDLIVLERRDYDNKVKWLVSAKHKAHGKRAVSNKDEPTISDDVRSNGCDGFLGIYSTIMTSRLNQTFEGIARNTELEVRVFQGREIEGLVIQDVSPTSVFARYFPQSHTNFMKAHPPKSAAAPEQTNECIPDFTVVSEAMAVMKIHEARIRIMNSGDRKEAKVFKSLMAYSYIGSIRVFREVVLFASAVLAGETRHTQPDERERPSLVYYVLTKFLQEQRLFDQNQDYGPIMREVIYLSTRYILRRSYYHEAPLPASDMINLMKFIYHELKQVEDQQNQQFIKEQLQALKSDIETAKTEYASGYLRMIEAFEEEFESDLMTIPYFT